MHDPEDHKALLMIGGVLGGAMAFAFLALLAATGNWQTIGVLIALVAAIVLTWHVLSVANKRKAIREATRWEAKDAALVRTEKLEVIGHTLGGLSDPEAGEVGGLSEAAGGELSPAEDER